MNNEYDVPQSTAECSNGATDPAKCVHRIQSWFQGKDFLSKGSGCMVGGDPNACMDPKRVAARDRGYFKLMYAAAHCHAPSCQSMELWDLDKKKLLCRNDARIGQGDTPMDEKAPALDLALAQAQALTLTLFGRALWSGFHLASGVPRRRACNPRHSSTSSRT